MTALEINDQLTAGLDQARATIATLNAESEARNAAHVAELAARDAQIAHLKSELEAATALGSEAAAKIDALAKTNEALEAKLAMKPAFADVSGGAEPVADGGNAPEPKKAFTRADIARMTPAQYSANRDEILKQLKEGKIR